MKHAFFLLCASLLLTSCICRQYSPPESDEFISYKPLSPEENNEMKRAISNCREVVLVQRRLGWRNYRKSLKQGWKLRRIMKKLASVPQWYVNLPNPAIHVNYTGESWHVYFCDEEGNILQHFNGGAGSYHNYSYTNFFGSEESIYSTFEFLMAPKDYDRY